MRNVSSCKTIQVARSVTSILLALVLALALIPAVSISEAFASSLEPSVEDSSDSADVDIDGDGSVQGDDVESDEIENAGVVEGGLDDAQGMTAAKDELVDDDYGVAELSLGDDDSDGLDDLSWMNSDRFINGVPVDSGMSRTATGSSTFMKFSRGNHQNSDAMKGIDVSEWQYDVDWSKVKASGIDFVIIRSSYGFNYKDKYFVQNVRGCLNNNIPFGVYHYARAANASEAAQEAEFVKSQLQAAGVTSSNISYPVYYDIENENQANLSASLVKNMANAFISRLNSAGYKAGVYASTSWWQGNAPCSQLNGLEYRWIAEYNQGVGLTYSGFGSGGDSLKNNGRGVWQFSSAGRVNGISGNVDLNYSYYSKLQVSANAKIDCIDRNGGTFRVLISGVKSNQTLTSVKVALWCTEGGQDDLKWYPAGYSSGSYYICAAIKDHKYQTGTYVAHAYFYSKLGSVQPSSAQASANIAFNPRSVSYSLASGNTAAYVTMSGGEFPLATSASIAVWTTRNGQDDLRWYTAHKSGSAWKGTVDIRNHRETGTYNMHVYAVVGGVNRCLYATTFNLSSYGAPVSMAAALNANETVFCAAGRGGALDDASSASFAVWSAAGGQDDLRWYGAPHMSDGSWAMNAPVSNHRTAGLYYVHAYANVGGKLTYVGQSTFTVHTPKATGLRMFQLSESSGTFTVYADGISGAPVSGVRVAVWATDKGQDDLRWYDTIKLGGSYTFGAYMSNHRSQIGLYVADVYVTMPNGIDVFAGRTTANLTMSR